MPHASQSQDAVHFTDSVKLLLVIGVIGLVAAAAAGVISWTTSLPTPAKPVGLGAFVLGALALAIGFGMARAQLRAHEQG